MGRVDMFHRAHRRPGPTAAAGKLLGTAVAIALPVQRRSPQVLLAACGAEIASFSLLAITASFIVLGALALSSVLVLSLAVTNRKLVLAFAGDEVIVMAASLRGRPLGPLGSLTVGDLPEPRGIGAAVTLDDATWWVDRASFPRLQRARQLRPGAIAGG